MSEHRLRELLQLNVYAVVLKAIYTIVPRAGAAAAEAFPLDGGEAAAAPIPAASPAAGEDAIPTQYDTPEAGPMET